MNPTDEPMTTVALNGGTEVSAEVLSTLAEIGEEVNASLDPDEVLARSAALNYGNGGCHGSLGASQ